ncbi:hypothetical protein [Streptomyces sp. NPDC093707]|uniref:hypothetical protein n=1 Tax=Streptomyces sp. NPDC093707 TaxID=3154984 RepID=UPI00344E3088
MSLVARDNPSYFASSFKETKEAIRPGTVTNDQVPVSASRACRASTRGMMTRQPNLNLTSPLAMLHATVVHTDKNIREALDKSAATIAAVSPHSRKPLPRQRGRGLLVERPAGLAPAFPTGWWTSFLGPQTHDFRPLFAG